MTTLILIRSDSTCFTYNDGWVDLETLTPTEQDFIDYGIEDITTIPILAFNEINRPFEVLKYIEGDIVPSVDIGINDTEIYWAVRINDTIYSKVDSAWEEISESEIFIKGMPEAEIETVADLTDIFTEGTVEIIGAAKSNSEDVTWWVKKVEVDLPTTFETGSTTIMCPQFLIADWETIDSITITQEATDEDDIRFAFSFDDKHTWKTFKPMTKHVDGEELTTEDNFTFSFEHSNLVGGSVSIYGSEGTYSINTEEGIITFNESQEGNNIIADYSYISDIFEWQTITDISTEGMTKTEVELISDLPITKETMDIKIWLSNNDVETSPSVSQIIFYYTAVNSPILSDILMIPVPGTGFRNVLVDGTYTLRLAEGIAFDDAEVDYDFYTTPNKIKLRPLDMGDVTGGRYSNVYAVEIINGYENEDFNVILSASKGGQAAEIRDSHGLFFDSEREASRTRIELSLVGEEGFNPTYPLQFNLNRDSSRIFYVRIKPTLTTAGYDTFQIKLIGRAI